MLRQDASRLQNARHAATIVQSPRRSFYRVIVRPEDVDFVGTGDTSMHADHVVAGGLPVLEWMQAGLQAEAFEQFPNTLLGQIMLGPKTSLITVVRVQVISEVVCVTLFAHLPDNLRHVGCGGRFIRETRQDQENCQDQLHRRPPGSSTIAYVHLKPSFLPVTGGNMHYGFTAPL